MPDIFRQPPPGLFANPNVHRDDPESSALAAKAIERSRSRHALLVLSLVKRFPGKTATELYDLADMPTRADLKEPQEVRRRLTDLQHAGLVTRGDLRKCGVRGTSMCVWNLALLPTP